MAGIDPITKALEEMSRAQSDHIRKYGESDPLLQKRIELLMKKRGQARATPKKKKLSIKRYG